MCQEMGSREEYQTQTSWEWEESACLFGTALVRRGVAEADSTERSISTPVRSSSRCRREETDTVGADWGEHRV